MTRLTRLTQFARMKGLQAQTHGGSPINIKVRKDLLKPPVTGNAVGKLHLNGTTLHLPQDRKITIGNSRKCDIRIVDPAIQPEHLIINPIGDAETVKASFQVVALNKETIKVGITDKTTKDTMFLDETTIDPIIENDSLLALELSGGKSCSMMLEILQPEVKAMRDLLASLVTRPQIEQVSVPETAQGTALVRVEGESKAPIPIDPKLVEGTRLSLARTIDELLIFYLTERDRVDRLFFNLGATAGGVGALGLVGHYIAEIITAASAFPEVAGIMVLSILFAVPTIYFGLSIGKLDKDFIKILRKLDRTEVANELARRNKQEREEILELINVKDPLLATAIRMELIKVLEASGDLPRSRIKISEEGKPEIVAAEIEAAEAEALAAEEAAAEAEEQENEQQRS